MEQSSFSDSSGFPKPLRSSRDEMNLAEFPLTVLSTRASTSQKTLEFKDSIKNKNGQVLERSWIITGADKFGLPTASDDEVLLGLIKLTVADNFRDRKVYFTRYDLLRTLRWTTEGRSYQRLQKALDRLTGVKIKATNAFYDNSSKAHSTRHFGIIDAYEINDGRSLEPKPSFFTWSDVIFGSFKSGFIKKLDLDFYLDLQSAVSKRLYRFLDKHFWYRSRVEINLFTLAHEKIGVSRNYQFASSLRQQLDPAFDELQEKGFISSYAYAGKGKDTAVFVNAPNNKARSLQAQPVKDAPPEPASSESPQQRRISGFSFNESSNTIEVEGESFSSLKGRVERLLLERGIKSAQLTRLVGGRSFVELERIVKIIAHFDSLLAMQSHLVSRSPVGFLYRAVEAPERFALPDDNQAQYQTELELGQGGATLSTAALAAKSKVRTSAKNKENVEALYLTFRKREIFRLRSEVEPELLKSLRKEVEEAFQKIKGSISSSRFPSLIDHGVDEKLAKLFDVPDMNQWLRERRS